MCTPKIFILGGTGNTGSLITQYLLQETQASLMVSSRRLEKAQAVVRELNAELEQKRVSAYQVDAANFENLQNAFQGMDWIVVASSTSRFTANIARAALEVGAHYLDVQYGNVKYSALRNLETEIKQQGLCFITDSGFHPGLPAALVRRAAMVFDHLETANVSSVIQIDWGGLSIAQSTGDEMIEEITGTSMEYFKDGHWQQANWLGTSGLRYFEFGPTFGRRYCMPMTLEEMRPLPDEFPSLRETGFYVGGFNWFVDWLVFPLAYAAQRLFQSKAVRPMSRLLQWGLVKFSHPPYGTMLKLEATGLQKEKPARFEIQLFHLDGYVLTAVPAVACLLQCLEDSAPKPGLWTQAWIVDPERFLQDIERMGIQITQSNMRT